MRRPLRLLALLAVAWFASVARADEREDRILAHVTKIGGQFTRVQDDLISINLNDTAATDGDLEVVGGLSNLQALDLRSTRSPTKDSVTSPALNACANYASLRRR